MLWTLGLVEQEIERLHLSRNNVLVREFGDLTRNEGPLRESIQIVIDRYEIWNVQKKASCRESTVRRWLRNPI